MPNKYEREIEEILRNMERTEPKPGLGQKLGGRIRRKSDSRSNVRKRSELSLHFGVSEWCLAIAVCASLFAGGWALCAWGRRYFHWCYSRYWRCLPWDSAYFAIYVAVPLFKAIWRIWESNADTA